MLKELKSKLIDAVSYDPETKRLLFHMSNGERREYADVPSYVYDDILVTKSPGSYYRKLIKPKFDQAGRKTIILKR